MFIESVLVKNILSYILGQLGTWNLHLNFLALNIYDFHYLSFLAVWGLVADKHCCTLLAGWLAGCPAPKLSLHLH